MTSLPSNAQAERNISQSNALSEAVGDFHISVSYDN